MFTGIIVYIINSIGRRSLLFAIILLILFGSISNFYASPNWFNPSVYAKYKARLEDGFILFNNNTIIRGNWDVYIYWECIEVVNDDIARLFINITLVGLDNTSPTFSCTDYALLNISSRKVFHGNREVGVTSIFLEEIPRENEEILLFRIGSYKVNGTVDVIRVIPTDNFGFQKAICIKFNISMSGLLNKRKFRLEVRSSLKYDDDTGLLLDDSSWTSDPLLFIVGIKMIFVSDISLIETNIDIGPSDIITEIRIWLSRVLFVTVIISPIVLVSYIVYRRKVKKSAKTNS